MSDSANENSAKPNPTELPKAHVLNYVTAINSPTRVRQIAAVAIGIIGILLAVVAVCAVAMLISDIHTNLQLYYFIRSTMSPPLARRESLFTIFRELAGFEINRILWAACYTTTSIVLLACWRGVRRGRRTACVLAMLALLPVTCYLLVVGAWIGGMAIIEGFGIGVGAAQPKHLLFFLVTAVLGIIILLLFDLVRFLRWIARDPHTEKPAVPFLPVASAEAQNVE